MNKEISMDKKDQNQNLTAGNFEKSELVRLYRSLKLGRALDNRAPNYLKQAIGWSYHAPCAGHDAIQLAIGEVFDRTTDHFFPYYRDLQATLSAGLTAKKLFLTEYLAQQIRRWRTSHV